MICDFSECCSFWEYSHFRGDCSFGYNCRFRYGSSFGKLCKFDECCSFGKGISFGEKCILGQDGYIENEHITNDVYPLLCFSGIGYVHGTTYFFNCEDGIWVRCGDFFGTIEQFREQVEKIRIVRMKKEYLMISDLVEMKWR